MDGGGLWRKVWEASLRSVRLPAKVHLKLTPTKNESLKTDEIRMGS